MSGRALLGMETEYALGTRREPGAWDRARVADALLTMARSGARPYLPEARGGLGVFLANGGRFYVDRGYHPEFATPECEDPWQVVAYGRAGETYLQQLLADAERLTPMARNTLFFRCAVDYSRLGASWGCHESYLHSWDPASLPDHLLPHLITRIIYSGAGGFHPMAPGLEFTLSPRAWLLSEAVSTNSTHSRGIYHAKNEPLSGNRWARMHVICGESLCSDRAGVLKLGTTALVLAAVEAGARPGYSMQLKHPVEALRTIAADPGCGARVTGADGRRFTAIEIQRFYLRMVEDSRRKGHLPEWAPDLCGLWRSTLDALERGEWATIRELDWGLKLELYRERTRKHGLEWSALPIWSTVMRRLERVAARIFEDCGPPIAELLRDHSRFQKEIDRVTPVLRCGGMTWSDAQALFRLRHELLEADMRFGQIGAEGIYQQLIRAGMVGPRAARPVPDPSPRVTEPPVRGRAQVRGSAVREIWQRGEAGQHQADWHFILGPRAQGRLDLSNPFCERASWIGPAEMAQIVARVLQAGA